MRAAGLLRTAVLAGSEMADSPLLLLDYALRLLRLLILLALWRLILDGRPASGPMPLAAVLTYTLIGQAFAEQLEVRTTLANSLWQGTIVMRFLRPLAIVPQFAAEMAGRWATNFVLFSCPVLLLAGLLGVDPRPASPLAGLLFVLSLALGTSLGLALEFLVGGLTVALEQPVWIVERVRVGIATLLSGSLLPLAYYPWGLGDAFAWLPFASLAWAPLAIFTASGDPWLLLGRQVAWSVILWPLVSWFWRANREKLVAYGG
jgi:ABC-2 type transport system permease protein